MVALALPLAPLAPGAAAAAGTFVIGSAAYIAQQVHGFRAPLPAPMIPRTGGKAGGASMQEMVADAVAGARIPVALPPNPLGPRGSIGLVGLLAAAGFIRSGLSQLWGLFGSRSRLPEPNHWYPPGPTKAIGGNYLELREVHDSIWSSFQEFISLVNTKTPGPSGTFYWRLTRKRADGSIVTNELPRSDAEIAVTRLVCTSGRTCTGSNAPPTSVPPGVAVAVSPAWKPHPLPKPALPPPRHPAAPTQDPEPGRSPTPVEPGPARPPVTVPAPPSTAPKAPPVPARVIVVRPDGRLPAPAKDPVAVTHPDAHYPIPGGGPIVGNGPQAKPEEIAKELGRLEQKLNGILNPTPDTPIEWRDLLQQVLEAIMNLKDGTTYTITEKCPPCDPNQQYDPPTVEAEAPGALNAFGVITNRLDAIAALLDGQLGLKQQICPPCKPQLSGEWVSVHFVSDEASPGGEKPLRKRFRYLDQTFAPLADHVAHWEHFEWDAGPVIVVSKNLSWGVPKVWAATAAEGKRVIRHAAQIAGVNLQDPRHQWIVTGSGDPRYGQTGHMRVDTRGGQFVRITKRPGPDGLPTGVAPTS